MKKVILGLTIISLLIIATSCNTQTTEGPSDDEAPPTASMNIALEKTTKGSQLIESAEIVISAADMDTIRQALEVSDTLITGKVEDIPAGENRLFELFSYKDDGELIYYGKETAEVIAWDTIKLVIILYPVNHNGDVIIVGIFDDDYRILFEGAFPGESREMFTMNIDGSNIVSQGTGSYSVWDENKQSIYYLLNHDIYHKDLNAPDTPGELLHDAQNLLMHMHLSLPLNSLLLTHKDSYYNLLRFDLDEEEMYDLSSRNIDETDAQTSRFDDWIYYRDISNENYTIKRMKPDGSQDETILADDNFTYSNCSVSFHGNFLVSVKKNSELIYISVYDIEAENERLIDITDLTSAGYPALTKDNKYIVFTSPGPDNAARNIYRINFDGTELMQLTNFESDYLTYRPLIW